MDSFYTPTALADILVSLCEVKSPNRIADFAAGNGSLLKSALARWQSAEITAMDVDAAAIESLAEAIPQAKLRHDDFLRFSDVETHRAGSGDESGFDAIFLNPPFSCRGGTTVTAHVGGQLLRGSLALAFVARALAYLGENGELLAILPSSCLTSKRDAPLRAALREKWDIIPLGGSMESAFPRCSVTIDIVRVTKRTSKGVGLVVPLNPVSHISRGRLCIMRGSIPNANGSSTQNGDQFVHSTDLRSGAVSPPTRWSNIGDKRVSGTALLIPRVGRIKISKVVLKTDPKSIALSECVIALQTPDRGDESALLDLLHRNWRTFSLLWTGSCAPYVTIERLTLAFEAFGYDVQHVKNMVVRGDDACGLSIDAAPKYLSQTCATEDRSLSAIA